MQVELVRQRRLDFDDDIARPDLVGVRMEALDRRGDRVQQRDIVRDALLDVGPQHLDDDLASARQRRRMHLRDRSGRERRAVERSRSASLIGAPSAFSIAARASASGNGATRSCSVVSSSATSARQQIAPRRKDLAELHEDRPKLGQRHHEPRAARRIRDVAARPRQQCAHELERAIRDAPRRRDRRAGSAPARRRCASGAESAAAASRVGFPARARRAAARALRGGRRARAAHRRRRGTPSSSGLRRR